MKRLEELVNAIAVYECRLAGQLPLDGTPATRTNYYARQITEMALRRSYLRLSGYVLAVLDQMDA